MFKGLYRLQGLDLRYNFLSALPRDIFRNQFKLVYIDLTVNRLDDIPSQMFTTLHSLQYLWMTYTGSAFDILMRDLFTLSKLRNLGIIGHKTNVTNTTFHTLADVTIQKFQLVWVPISKF